MMGRPRRVFPSAPAVLSNSSACSRAQAAVLGAYSPVSGMTGTTGVRCSSFPADPSFRVAGPIPDPPGPAVRRVLRGPVQRERAHAAPEPPTHPGSCPEGTAGDADDEAAVPPDPVRGAEVHREVEVVVDLRVVAVHA